MKPFDEPLTAISSKRDSLSADAISSRLAEFATPPWIREIRVLEETTSTNDLVAQIGRDGAEEMRRLKG